MAIKTFNIDAEVYKQFLAHCKKHGISMSKRVEHYLREELTKINKYSVKKDLLERKDNSALHPHTFSKYC